jgi:hypothetical protein
VIKLEPILFLKEFKYIHLNQINIEDFDQALQSNTLLLTPEKLMQKELWYYECSTCGKKSFSELKSCSALKKIVDFNHYCILFLDDLFVIYQKPDGFSLQELHVSYDQERQVAVEQPTQPESLMESQEPLMESPLQPPPLPLLRLSQHQQHYPNLLLKSPQQHLPSEPPLCLPQQP